MKRLFLAPFLLFMIGSAARAEVPRLKAVGPVAVIVEKMRSDSPDFSLDPSVIQQGIESRLRNAHIPYCAPDDAAVYLSVHVDTLYDKVSQMYICDISLFLLKHVKLSRIPDRTPLAGIWSGGSLCVMPADRLALLESNVYADLGLFITQYAHDNPSLHITIPSPETPAAPAPSAPPVSTPAPADPGNGSPSPSPETPAPAPETSRSSNPVVWVNLPNGIYHYSSSKWYGKTKRGKYLHEDEAIRAGYRAARNEK